eukprot:2496321-Amphidinium_carterae.3
MAAQDAPAVAKCCRVWLPDLVLPCGDRLRGALEGTNGSNFAFLRKKYSDNMKFSIYGKASSSMCKEQDFVVIALQPGRLFANLIAFVFQIAGGCAMSCVMPALSAGILGHATLEAVANCCHGLGAWHH